MVKNKLLCRYVAPPASSELERATIVLATPHCSYTGINDIVDLAVARGGDSALLESLTSDDDELKYPRTLLADQLATLKHALTKPNIQLLIYEVHSILPSETTEMVNQVVDYANGIAKEKYLKETTVGVILKNINIFLSDFFLLKSKKQPVSLNLERSGNLGNQRGMS